MFDDGTVLSSYRSIDKTAESIVQFASRDAETYRQLGRKCVTLGALLSTAAATPPLPFARFLSLLDNNELGRELASGLFK